MRDSRLGQVGALVDDARCLLADIEGEGWPVGLSPEELRLAISERHQIRSARAYLNTVIDLVNKVEER